MTENIKDLYKTYIKNEAKFVARREHCANLAEYDLTLNWVLERYLWVSTAKTDEEYRARHEKKRK